MATPTSFNPQLVDFVRLAVQDTVTNPQAGLCIFPQNSTDTTLSLNITSSVINVRYITSTTTTQTVNYVNKTLEEVAVELNSLGLPLKAVPTLRNYRLSSNDIYLYNTGSYYKVPDAFRILDRVSGNGVLVRTNKFSVSHKQDTNFSLQRPYNSSVHLPWYPTITNGEFTYKHNGTLFRFRIPEFDSQVWSVKYGKPFKEVIGGALIPFKANAFKVERGPIFWSGENIKLYNEDTLIPSSLIEDVDTANGIIYFKNSDVISDRTSVDYTYLEANYEYMGVNINAHMTQNPTVLDKFVTIYALPVEGLNYQANKKTIYHTITDSVDDAIASIESQVLDCPVVIIGSYAIQQVYTSDRISILDTRSYGGGLVDPFGPKSTTHSSSSVLNEKKGELPEDLIVEKGSFFDIGCYDGKAYPGAGAVSIDLPDSIKGLIPEVDTKLRATKFLAAGIYPIVSYYKSQLPAISGISTQIAGFFNGELLSSVYGQTGACWLRNPVNLPGGASGNWTTSTTTLPIPASKIDGTGVIRSTPDYSIYQSYLKSTPIAGIEYYKRDLVLSKNSNGEEYRYSEWEKVSVTDSRSVATGQLVKGYLSFPSSVNTTEYRSVTVSSPYRLDYTGQFKSDLASEIYNIHNAISGRTELVFTSGLNLYPVVYDFRTPVVKPYADYIGTPKPLDYVSDLIYSDLSGSYSGFYQRIGDFINLSLALSDNSYSGRMKFYDQNSQTYRDTAGTITGLDLSPVLETMSTYGAYRKEVFGTGDSTYTSIRTKMSAIVASHTTLAGNTKYLPAYYDYNVNAITSAISVSGQLHKIPEVTGFSPAEVIAYNNTDYNYLRSMPGIASSVRLVDNFTGSYAQLIRPHHATIWSGAASAISRMPDAINGTRTSYGNVVVQHWYMPYNRYGTYAGSLSRQLIACYEHLYKAQTSVTGGLSWSGTPGIDVRTLATGFSYIESTLYNAFSGFNETLQRGGMLDDCTADLLYSYGWYALNKDTHQSHVQTYNPSLAGVVSNNYKSIFSGVFHTGLWTTIKGSVTINGDMFETTIVNGEQGPFEVKTPTKIFDTLSIACRLSRTEYLPIAQAVFNTVSHNYGSDGYYYSDPLKFTTDVGTEEKIIRPLISLYKAVQ